MADTLDRTLRRLMRCRPEICAFSPYGLILHVGSVKLVKQHRSSWVMVINGHAGSVAYVRLSWITRMCIEMLRAGKKAKWEVCDA